MNIRYPIYEGVYRILTNKRTYKDFEEPAYPQGGTDCLRLGG